MQHWLIKTEPGTYSWDDFVKEGSTMWDGVRNYAANNNLREMRADDKVFVYHSITDKMIVGIAKVVGEAQQDSTTTDKRWYAIEMAADKPLHRPVSLAEVKKDPRFRKMQLVTHGRLSVQAVTPEQFADVVEMSKKAAKR